MGCDLSKQTKKAFDEQSAELCKSIQALQHHQKTIKATLDQMVVPAEPEVTVESLQSSILPFLANIEKLLEEVKVSKENKEIEDLFDREKNSGEKKQKNKFQVSTKAESYEAMSRGESPNMKGERESNILDDPTIKALIEKNRLKFAGIKKGV